MKKNDIDMFESCDVCGEGIDCGHPCDMGICCSECIEVINALKEAENKPVCWVLNTVTGEYERGPSF